MTRRGVRRPAAEFQSSVNVVFHRYESAVYDSFHRNMWESLPCQFSLFAEDSRKVWNPFPEQIRLLDIGCGTGLASDSLLKSCLGPSITHIDLLDTSSAMLAQAQQRSRSWNRSTACHEGLIGALPVGQPYDLIVTCSVLHHVPDLADFASHVRRLQADKGVFLHLQDPNGDHLSDPDLKDRTAQLSGSLTGSVKSFTDRVFRRLRFEITRKRSGEADVVDRTNTELLRTGIIQSPMTIAEVYAITDIHVQDGEGISISRMKQWLPDYELISQRSYGFFGELWYDLPAKLRSIEEDLIRRRKQNGFHVGAAWKLR
jgi:SAM-dependent methyltransferase